MNQRFLSGDGETPMLLLPSLQIFQPPDHLARLIVTTVEQLNLCRIEEANMTPYWAMGRDAPTDC
jgi:hypothetical protein